MSYYDKSLLAIIYLILNDKSMFDKSLLLKGTSGYTLFNKVHLILRILQNKDQGYMTRTLEVNKLRENQILILVDTKCCH